MPYQRLLLKLKAHGIGDGIIDWIEQWLIDRRQCVVVDGEVSNWKSVLSGVPPGFASNENMFLVHRTSKFKKLLVLLKSYWSWECWIEGDFF